MTATIDSPTAPPAQLPGNAPEPDRAACPTPGKRAFGTLLAALAFAAEHDEANGTDNTPYACDCGAWHNTTHPRTRHRPRTTSSRIDLLAATFPAAPLRPATDLGVGFYLLTPKIAAFWLQEFNGHNRNLRDAAAGSLALDLATGGFEFNGDTFRFSVNGLLLDGQHRGEAVARTGIPIPIILVTGLEPVAQDTIDTGRRRTFADALRLAGESDPNNVAATTAQVCRWKADRMRANAGNLSVKVLQRVLADHPEIREATRVGRRVARMLGGAPSSVSSLASWLFRSLDPADHDDFFDKLVTGQGIDTAHPVWVLREALRRNAADKRKLRSVDLLAYYIKTWNHYRAGTTKSTLSWRSGGRSPEPFPVPQ